MSMQEVSYQCKDNTPGIENKRHESVHSAKRPSLNGSASISSLMRDIPATHMFSPTILQFISTVCLLFILFII